MYNRETNSPGATTFVKVGDKGIPGVGEVWVRMAWPGAVRHSKHYSTAGPEVIDCDEYRDEVQHEVGGQLTTGVRFAR
ncbi:hypothetical protein J6590_002206 [Homalodisca vitripennis]|nr:hypothetical protein J6590_002206 [Homalodisca vitripennis]